MHTRLHDALERTAPTPLQAHQARRAKMARTRKRLQAARIAWQAWKRQRNA